MRDREITVCDDSICRYSIDAGCFIGEIEWLDDCFCELFLICSPYKPIDMLLVKLGFETLYRERESLTEKAIEYACSRFIPYFRYVSGSTDDLMEEVLPKHLIPCSIEFGINGAYAISFQSFYIGTVESNLIVNGQMGRGFLNLKDGCKVIPDV